MPAPRFRHPGTTQSSYTGAFLISKEDFAAPSGYLPSDVYWGKSKTDGKLNPFVYASEGAGQYVQLAGAGHIDMLAQYVDQKLEELEVRLSKRESDAGDKAALKTMPSKDDLASLEASVRRDLERVAGDMETSTSALKALCGGLKEEAQAAAKDALASLEASMRRDLAQLGKDIHTSTSALEAICTGLKEEMKAAVRGLTVAACGESSATAAARRDLSTAAAAHQKASGDLKDVERLIASGTPIDNALARQACVKAEQALEACGAAVAQEEAADATARSQLPAELVLVRAINDKISDARQPYEEQLQQLRVTLAEVFAMLEAS